MKDQEARILERAAFIHGCVGQQTESNAIDIGGSDLQEQQCA